MKPSGHFVVVDELGEVVATRLLYGDDIARDRKIHQEMSTGLGQGCTIVYREGPPDPRSD